MAQITFLKAHRARGDFQHPRGSGTHPDIAVAVWFKIIARNAVIDHLRRQYRRGGAGWESVVEAMIGLQSSTTPIPTPTPESMMLEAERQGLVVLGVREAVERLPEAQRDVVTRHKFCEESMVRLAEEWGVTHVALRVRAHRAYANLARELATSELGGPYRVA